MPNITIRTQAEFDALPESFEEATRIIIRNNPTAGRIIIRRNRDNASVRAYDNASVQAYDNASVSAYGNASVVAWDNAFVEVWGNASVWAYDNASVWAYDNASVEARGNASVVAHNQAAIRRYSATSKIVLNEYAVCWNMCVNPIRIIGICPTSNKDSVSIG